ncbi:diguanylate cyclase domain-containing protein [Nodosilinea sp. E11]|uniref:diguanylate cyclase domain-containing protein n=1 Tax=Nodosilinea sp. E11 TaxID=3037479 RepID=UPI002934A7FA|nr:diguanylate cyclase [Nodosilinea sp. E11]WOD41318.1 diguanylate cyclase [Nodosilinea sp. E11]
MTRNVPPQPAISQSQILGAVATIGDAIALGCDLDEVLQQGVDLLRPLLDTDRVVIYRFLPDEDGVIAAESVGLDWLPLQGQLIYDPCFGNGWGDRYRQGHVGMVEDVQRSSLEPCHAELLTRLQVQANLTVPILAGSHLWALLIAHHCRSPRQWSQSGRDLMQHVAHQLGQGIYQNDLEQQLQLAQQQLAQQQPQNRRLSSETEQLFQLFTDHVEQLLFIRDAVSGQFLYVNHAFERIWAQPRAALYRDPDLWLRQVHPDDLPQVQASVTRQFEGQSVRREYRILRPSGEVRWIQAHVRVVEDDQNRPRHLVGWAEDCTDRKQLQAHLRATEAILSRRVGQEQLLRMLTARMRESLDFDKILSAAVAGIKTVFNADRAVIFEIVANGDRRIVQQATHPNYVTITDAMIPKGPLPLDYLRKLCSGHPQIYNDMATAPWTPGIVAFLESVEVKSAMVAPIAHPPGGDSRSDPYQNRQLVWGFLTVHACGQARQWQPFEANMLQHFGDQLTTALHQAELYRQLQAANQALDRMAKVDSLTQLANRRWLDDYLNQEWQRLARERKPLSVILADVDFFKPYNDTYGHAAGDRCLVAIADAIRHGVRRPADLAARYGGEEFALVLPDTDRAGAIRVVQMVRHHLQSLGLPHGASPSGNTITLSFGIVTGVPSPNHSAESMLKAADQALYAAKAAGRNQYQVFRRNA